MFQALSHLRSTTVGFVIQYYALDHRTPQFLSVEMLCDVTYAKNPHLALPPNLAHRVSDPCWIWAQMMTSATQFSPITPKWMNQFRCGFCQWIGIDIFYCYAKWKKIVGTVFEKIESVNFWANLGQKGPQNTGFYESIEMRSLLFYRYW